MMMVLKRREVLIGALIVMIGIAGIINWNYSREDTDMYDAVTASSVQEEQMGEHSAEIVDLPVDTGASSVEADDVQQVNSAVTATVNYFAEARMNRESARSKSIEMLNGLISNANTDAESKSKAQSQVLALAQLTDKEMTCENLIKAKGFKDAVVFVSDNTVNVTVLAESLSASDNTKIQEIINSQTGISIKNIKIVEVK